LIHSAETAVTARHLPAPRLSLSHHIFANNLPPRSINISPFNSQSPSTPPQLRIAPHQLLHIETPVDDFQDFGSLKAELYTMAPLIAQIAELAKREDGYVQRGALSPDHAG
jgi:hypothetical protein